ncbi:MAG: hypothetical protein ACERKZ_16840 [Lachnotalea sp.]
MKSCQLITYVTAIACFISENCSEEDLPIVTAMIQQLVDTLRTIIIQQEVCKNKVESAVAEVLTEETENPPTLDAQEVFTNFVEDIFNNYAIPSQ